MSFLTMLQHYQCRSKIPATRYLSLPWNKYGFVVQIDDKKRTELRECVSHVS